MAPALKKKASERLNTRESCAIFQRAEDLRGQRPAIHPQET
jgi:hypothetical protein